MSFSMDILGSFQTIEIQFNINSLPFYINISTSISNIIYLISILNMIKTPLLIYTIIAAYVGTS